MDRIKIDFPATPSMGFAATIGLLSYLLSTGFSYRLQVEQNEKHSKAIVDLVKIFRISPDIVEFVPAENNDGTLDSSFVDGLMDNAKTYSRYLTSDTVKLFNTTFPVNQAKRKKYVCLAISGSPLQTKNIYFNDTQQALENNNFPVKLRDYTRDEIDKIIELIIDSGYDIVTLESPYITIEHKVFVLNELCDCVIGYEGGMMHLAHCLGVPSIIFPWLHGHNELINSPIRIPGITRSMLMHIDKKTYFIKSPEELHSWDRNKFCQLIEDLVNEKGNNVLLNNDVVETIINSPIDIQFEALQVPVVLRDTIKNIKPLRIGGY